MIALSEEPRLITKVTSCQDAVEPRSPFHETRIAGRDSGVCHVLVRKRQLFCREKGLLKRLHAVIPERHSNQLGKDLITLDVDIIGKMRLGVMTGKSGNSFVCNNPGTENPARIGDASAPAPPSANKGSVSMSLTTQGCLCSTALPQHCVPTRTRPIPAM